VMIATEHITQPTMNPMQLSQRRLYVGNLPDDVTEAQLMEFFNNAMLKANVVKTPGTPVVSVTIYREKAYAFIELRNADEATIGMSFDGITLHGKSLRVRRPTDYQPPSNVMDMNFPSVPGVGSVSTNVSDSPHKIFIGGLPTHLNENDVKKLLSMFGQLRSFNLVRDAFTGQSKGFGFCEYSDPEVTDDACKSLNGMSITDKTLIVQRASVNPKNQTTFIPQGSIVNQAAANMLNLSCPAAQLLANAVKNATPEPTKILVLMNIINTVEFPGDRVEQEFDELVEDINEECSTYGNIRTLLIPRNPKREHPLPPPDHNFFEEKSEKYPFDDSEDDDKVDKLQEYMQETEGNESGEKPKEKKEEIVNVPGFGKVFVEYYDIEDAKKAQRALSGRRYDGRMVITSFHPEEKWTARLLEPDPLKIEDVYLKQEELKEELKELENTDYSKVTQTSNDQMETQYEERQVQVKEDTYDFNT